MEALKKCNPFTLAEAVVTTNEIIALPLLCIHNLEFEGVFDG